MTENRNVFWNVDKTSVEFVDKNGTDIDFFVSNNVVSIHIDEHSTSWDNAGYASIHIPKEHWKEFVEAINKLKFGE